MDPTFSLQQLSGLVNQWCEEHEILPASGQAGEFVSERNIRYYRTLGLVDPPEGVGYGEKHRLQLIAIRLLQAQGLPLRRIRDLLYGRSLSDLREIQKRGIVEAKKAASATRIVMPVGDELWRAIPIDEDFLLFSRRGTSLTSDQLEAVRRALQTESSVGKRQVSTTKVSRE